MLAGSRVCFGARCWESWRGFTSLHIAPCCPGPCTAASVPSLHQAGRSGGLGDLKSPGERPAPTRTAYPKPSPNPFSDEYIGYTQTHECIQLACSLPFLANSFTSSIGPTASRCRRKPPQSPHAPARRSMGGGRPTPDRCFLLPGLSGSQQTQSRLDVTPQAWGQPRFAFPCSNQCGFDYLTLSLSSNCPSSTANRTF